jgi:hypothetical protein
LASHNLTNSTINLPSLNLTSDLVESSKRHNSQISNLVKSLDKDYFTPKIRLNLRKKDKKRYFKSLVLQGSQINDKDSQFKMAKRYNINCLYMGVDNFLKKKRNAYLSYLKSKQNKSQDPTTPKTKDS